MVDPVLVAMIIHIIMNQSELPGYSFISIKEDNHENHTTFYSYVVHHRIIEHIICRAI